MCDVLDAYYAGFFDWEGNISIVKKNQKGGALGPYVNYMLSVVVTNTNKEIVELLSGRSDLHTQMKRHPTKFRYLR